MSATHEDLAARILQLEREVRELATRVSHDPTDRPDLADRISFRSWAKLSAPTFAVLLAGFTLLWNAQQDSTAQWLEVSRSLGRLDGAVAGLETTTARFDRRLEAFDERLAGIDQRLAGIDERLAAIDGSLDRLGAAVEKLAARI